MAIVTVKNKFQIVIPQRIREQVRVDIGDLLEAGIENGKITFTPKSLIDRHLAEGLQDVAEGRTHGPYKTAKEAFAVLDSKVEKKAKRIKKRR